MLVYFILLYTAIIIFLSNKTNKRSALLIMLLMLLVCGLRDYSVGIDTYSYVNKYIYNYNDYKSEILFDATYSVVHMLGGSGHLWILFVSIILYIPYIIAIIKYSKAPVLSALIFLISPSLFFFDSMNGIRQWTSGGWILLSFIYKNKNQIKKCIFCFAIALGFHLSSIVALPFLFMWKRIIPFKYVYVSLAIITILCITMSHFNFSSLFEQYTVLLDTMQVDADSKFSKYAQYSNMENTTNWKYYLVNIVPLNLVCIASYPIRSLIHNSQKKYQSTAYLFNVFFIGTVFMNICAISIPYGQRVFFSVITLQLLLMPKQFIKGNQKQKFFINCLIVYMIFWFIYYIISINGSRVGSTVPFSFFF